MAKNLVIGYGNTGRLIAAELLSKGEKVIIGRHGNAELTGGIEAVTVDVLKKDSVVAAAEGVQRVFVTTGLPYKLKIWQAQWPVIINNVLAACKAANAQLIFIDNIYLYGPAPLQNPITESHPRKPASKKGQVRLNLVNKLESAMQSGQDVLIVRSADFYGPSVNSSGVTMAIESLLKGKTAYFMGTASAKHTYSYVPDLAAATVLLALGKDTYNQTWHAPTSGPITGTDLMKLASKAAGNKGKWSTMTRKSMAAMGVFVPILRELREMMYQFEHDYVLDGSKFAAKYPKFTPTTYEQGIQATVDATK